MVDEVMIWFAFILFERRRLFLFITSTKHEATSTFHIFPHFLFILQFLTDSFLGNITNT